MKFLPSELALMLDESEMRQNLRALLKYVGWLVATTAAFSVLFHVIMVYEGQDHSWLTGLYWTLTVMSTLGFGDITFHSDLGRFFSIVVLVTGIILLLIVLPFTFIRFFYAPWLEAQVRLRAPRTVPKGTSGHVIICRYDGIATGLIRRLDEYGTPYFVIEADPAAAANLHADGISVVAGAPAASATYEALRVHDAALVVANLGDAENTNITLSVREASASVPILSLAEEMASAARDTGETICEEEIRQYDGRFEVLHFERLSEKSQEDDPAEEMLDPGALLLVLGALARLTDGVAVDPQGGAILSDIG